MNIPWKHAFSLKATALMLLVLAGFVGLVVFLSRNNFSEVVPAYGGVWHEGIVGTPRFLNPVLAQSQIDKDLVALTFAGLVRPDGKGGLVNELAESIEVSEDGTLYTVTLKSDLTFHDGEALTSEDVAFTIDLIQNPLLRSPLLASWDGVEVNVLDPHTITFQLGEPYSPFIENLRVGIVPAHIWESIEKELIPFSEYNFEPIGAGPFRFSTIRKDRSSRPERYQLESFEEYALGPSFLQEFIIEVFEDEKTLAEAFENGQIDAYTHSNKNTQTQEATKTIQAPMSRVFGIFFNVGEDTFLTSEAFVRRALRSAIDFPILREIIDVGELVFEKGKDETTKNLTDILEANDFVLNEDAEWEDDDGNILEVTLHTSNSATLLATSEYVAERWRENGIRVSIIAFEAEELTEQVIRPRAYEILLFGYELGLLPDLYPFWHSSQRNDPGLNITGLVNRELDDLTERLRLSNEPEDSENFYKDIVELIEEEEAVIFLYSPVLNYSIPENVSGIQMNIVSVSADRFSNVESWYVQTRRVLSL